MLFHLLRSSQRKYSLKKGVLENFAISTGKYLCCSHFLVMLQTFRPTTFIRRDSNIGIFLWVLRNFCEYFKNTHFEKILQTASSVLIYWVINSHLFFTNISLVNISLDKKTGFLLFFWFSFWIWITRSSRISIERTRAQLCI